MRAAWEKLREYTYSNRENMGHVCFKRVPIELWKELEAAVDGAERITE